jgi:hypothetical protein
MEAVLVSSQALSISSHGRLTYSTAKNEAAEIAKAEIPQQYTADVKVVMFPQLGYLVEVMMDQAQIMEVPLQYQVRDFHTTIVCCVLN